MDLMRMRQEMERSGKLQQAEKLAGSEDVAAAVQALDPEALARAKNSKDPAVLKAVLEQLLSTDAGKRLAEKVKAAMEHG